MAIDLQELGLTPEKLEQRVIDAIVDRLLDGKSFDVDGNPYFSQSDLERRLQKKITEYIDAEVKKLGDEKALPIVKEKIDTIVMQETNRWGEAQGTPISFIEYLVQRAEVYMTEEVNYEGKSQKENGWGSWSKSSTRVAYMVHKHLHYHIEQAMKQALLNANNTIKDGLEKAVKVALENALSGLQTSVTIKR